MSNYDPTRHQYSAPTQHAGHQQPPGYTPQQPGYGHGAPPPAPRKGSKLPWLLFGAGLIVVLLIVAALAAPKEETDNTGDTDTETPAAGTAEGQDVYAIGQTATTGDSAVTVWTVTDPYIDPSGFIRPNDGMRWVAVEVTITNPTDRLVTWSSILGAELTDSANRGWNITFVGTDLPSLDGDIPIQGERRGWLVFEVAGDSTGLVVRIKGNVTATGSLFQLTP